MIKTDVTNGWKKLRKLYASGEIAGMYESYAEFLGASLSSYSALEVHLRENPSAGDESELGAVRDVMNDIITKLGKIR